MLGVSARAQWTAGMNGSVEQFSYGNSQYIAFDTSSSYLRMIYGPTSGWGTSVVTTPCFWSGGHLYQGTPVTVTWSASNNVLTVNYTGSIANLKVSGTLVFQPPANNQLTATASVTVTGSQSLDNRPGEAYKPVFLSSMHDSSSVWDSTDAYNGVNWTALPVSGLIFNATTTGSRLTMDGGTSTWKTNAPTMDIYLNNMSMTTMGWVTQDTNPNDDNVGFWLGGNTLIPSYSYSLVCRKAN
jgi:hypothetical protein